MSGSTPNPPRAAFTRCAPDGGRANLLAATKRAVGPGCTVLLLPTPSAMGYHYPRLGMERAANGFLIRRDG